LLTLLLLPNLYYVIELRAQRALERKRRRAAERGELDDEDAAPVTTSAAAERMAP
jgi:cobalt-zinc-cadmium resistance protein CzcA